MYVSPTKRVKLDDPLSNISGEILSGKIIKLNESLITEVPNEKVTFNGYVPTSEAEAIPSI